MHPIHILQKAYFLTIYHHYSSQYWHVYGNPKTGLMNLLPLAEAPEFSTTCAGEGIDFDKLVAGGLEEFKRVFNSIAKNPNVEVTNVRWISAWR